MALLLATPPAYEGQEFRFKGAASKPPEACQAPGGWNGPWRAPEQDIA